MNQKKNQELIEKIKDRAKRSLKIKEVYLESKTYDKAREYLKKQKYLEYSKVSSILKNNFEPKYPIAYIMEDQNDNVVGFMGTIFSKRVLNNNERIYCNIHSWIVNKDQRLNSFFLLTSLPEENITFTAFTPIKTLVGLLEKFDFQKINIKYKVVPLFDFLSFFKTNNFTVEREQSNFQKKLNKHDFKIYQNYKNLPYEKFIITNNIDKSNYIFVVASKIRKKGLNVLNLFYVSNKEEFKKKWHKLKTNISKEFKVKFALHYFFDNSDSIFPGSVVISKTIEQEICVKNLSESKDLDIIYSDLVE
tara:strand:- start:104 stop:1018 length:915 start_codon:yes stop_codon:yes gene_type:complete